MTKSEEIYKGLEYVKNILNSISVTGIDNCQKMVVIYNNIDVVLNMITSGQMSINCTDSDTEKLKTKKPTK